MNVSTEDSEAQTPGVSSSDVQTSIKDDNIPYLQHLNAPESDDELDEFFYPGSENVSKPDDRDEEDAVFQYPGTSVAEAAAPTHLPEEPPASLPTATAYDSPSTPHLLVSPPISTSVSRSTHTPPRVPPSASQLEDICAAASSGDLDLLKELFMNAVERESTENFGLANGASHRTGYTALHVAASRGHLDVISWLIEECGAMPDLEDREGETALHKAALNGHMSIVSYLVPGKADVHVKDGDGWTALHNACSKGYLDIVRYLCEQGGAAQRPSGSREIDVRSNDGWTPLMNAASKGHLPVVRYLLTKQSANPLIRNNWGETAFDAAAAVFEIWICEVLQQAEAERWHGAAVSYNPLAVHTTVPLILYENQRLDTRLKTVAVSGGSPKFSASGLGKHGRRAPFELRLFEPEGAGVREVAAWRSGVQLPSLREPWALPNPGPSSPPIGYHDNDERSHFWLSDWTLDITHPRVDAEEGWQYAYRFDDPDEQWSAEKPHQLQRILNSSGLVNAGFGGPTPRGGSSTFSARSSQTWVRRRRWVRIMRRRLDISPLPFLEPDGAMYFFDSRGNAIPHVEDQHTGDGEMGRELGSMPSLFLTSTQDFVARARYLAGNATSEVGNDPASVVDARRAIAKLERATTELRQGILASEDGDRKVEGEALLSIYSRELDRRRLAAGAQELLINRADDEEFSDIDDEEFHYPDGSEDPNGASSSSRPLDIPRAPTDLTSHLSQAPDFRVPTHEAPQKVITPRWTSSTHHIQWERDEAVHQCRECQRRFTFINRRHCRRCGRIFCDRCSSYRVLLDPSDIVHDPSSSPPASSSSSQRVCRSCHEEVSADVPARFHGTRATSMERIVLDQGRLTVPRHLTRRQTSSQLSDLAECPVCNCNLDELGDAEEQELHVKNCLEGGTGATNSAKYLVYRLPAESTLLGAECVICLEEFVEGSLIARLSCLCSFHNACLSSWLQRGKSCPLHAR